MPTEKESMDYLGEFLMKYHRDQTLFTLETALKGEWTSESLQGFQEVLKSLSSDQKENFLLGLNSSVPALYMIYYLLCRKKITSLISNL